MKDGMKHTEIGWIPTDWEVTNLGASGEVLVGLTYRPDDVDIHGTLVLRSSNIQNGKLAFNDCVFVRMDLPDRVRVRENDLLICVRNGSRKLIGKCALISKSVVDEAFGAFMAVFRAPNNRFLFQVFQSSIIQQQIQNNLGATINQITNKDLKSYLIPVPSAAEQKAIAETLSDTDAWIESLEASLEKKRLIKQGAMQELLLPKEGWDVRKLGEFTTIIMGQSPASTYYNQRGLGLPLIQGNADLVNRATIIRNYTSSVTKRAERGDIILSVRAPVGEVARATFDCCIGRGVCAIKFENDYLYHYLIAIESSWSRHSTGSTFDSINSTQLKNIEITLPSDISEQLRIASILNDMDRHIAILEEKLSKARQIKLGMMQQLLTGRIRLVKPPSAKPVKISKRVTA